MELDSITEGAKDLLILKFIVPIFNSSKPPIEIANRSKATLSAATTDEATFRKELLGDTYPLNLNFLSVQKWLGYFIKHPTADCNQMDNKDSIGEMIFAKAFFEVLILIDKLSAYYKDRPVNRKLAVANDEDHESILNMMEPVVDELTKFQLQELKNHYNKVLLDNAEMIAREIKRYQPLFELGNHKEEWHDLSCAPFDMAQQELKELYLVCQSIQDGRLEDVVASVFIGRVPLLGKALAIQEYIKFLEHREIELRDLIKTFVILETERDPAVARIKATWSLLMQGEFIECSEEAFQSLFDEEKPKTKVRWRKNVLELSYFLHGIAGVNIKAEKDKPAVIFERGVLKGNHSSSTLDQIGRDCFIKSDRSDIGKDGIRKRRNAKPITISHLSKLDKAIKTLRGKHY